MMTRAKMMNEILDRGWMPQTLFDAEGPVIRIETPLGPIRARPPVSLTEDHTSLMESVYRVYGELCGSYGYSGAA